MILQFEKTPQRSFADIARNGHGVRPLSLIIREKQP
ncbi:hypothetical protein SAMN05444123_10687 [Rhodopseudomonas pseudopalustris]|uniref:Uncharacterized protein n=1 Tax=Rhodopseudomonas pseudopalustris TaxID=1513892 RepID=A0A1H8TRX0_9BRAD|nr:hypothetical protein SAMN05444123_10687 [Rhodopseudomonas pseudopalustris]